MSDELDSKLRTTKHEVEENSARIEKLVDQLVAKYNRDLDDFMAKVKNDLDNRDKLSDFEVENLTLRVPLYMYFGVNGIETLGVQLDAAKAVKAEVYNDKYMNASGTIQDKKSEAENSTIPEHLMVVCYERAYKKLKTKMDVAEQMCQASRKVLQKRISELEVFKKDKGYTQSEDNEWRGGREKA